MNVSHVHTVRLWGGFPDSTWDCLGWYLCCQGYPKKPLRTKNTGAKQQIYSNGLKPLVNVQIWWEKNSRSKCPKSLWVKRNVTLCQIDLPARAANQNGQRHFGAFDKNLAQLSSCPVCVYTQNSKTTVWYQPDALDISNAPITSLEGHSDLTNRSEAVLFFFGLARGRACQLPCNPCLKGLLHHKLLKTV